MPSPEGDKPQAQAMWLGEESGDRLLPACFEHMSSPICSPGEQGGLDVEGLLGVPPV